MSLGSAMHTQTKSVEEIPQQSEARTNVSQVNQFKDASEDDSDDDPYPYTPEELHLKYHDKFQLSYIKEHSEWDELPFEYLADFEVQHYPPRFALGIGLKNLEDAWEFARRIPDPLPNHDSSLFAAFNTMARHFEREGLDVTMVVRSYLPKPPDEVSFVLRLTTNYCEGQGWKEGSMKVQEILDRLGGGKRLRWYLLMENFTDEDEHRTNWCPSCPFAVKQA